MKPYVKVARGYLDKELSKIISKELPEFPSADCHLAWMLEEILLEYMTETKANRWLGYIQGVMACKGYINVSEERNRTRNIFNGE